ncbi:MAG: hypothetical protein CFE25_04910 [Chitinophagaceae bacterium BSSC1]|nr:MAG: hypothetical protein CFE25_04910 [Chitinophagaceae bacterium BSSC1]
MKEINELVKDYWAGKLNSADSKILLELLEEKVTDYSDEEYNAFIQLVKENSVYASKNDIVLKSIYKKIESRLEFETKQDSVFKISNWNKRKWIAAASLLLVACSIFWFISSRTSNSKIKQESTEIALISFSNNSNTVVDTLMSDGSIIRLYPKTNIQFADGFRSKNREVYLKGKALFKVAKDSNRPFIVFAEGFSTMALGTKFEINSNENNLFSVRLLEGKVVIKALEKRTNAFKDVFLTPGQEMVYNLKLNRIIPYNKTENPSKKIMQEDLGKQNRDNVNAVMSFNKLPLQIVLNQIEEEMSIKINYDTEKIIDKKFTGSFDKNASPKLILEKIAKEYGWKIKFENNIYIIE